MTGKVIAKKLHDIENAILGTQNNPGIQDRILTFGYTPARLEGLEHDEWIDGIDKDVPAIILNPVNF
jgi:hypothetical protein